MNPITKGLILLGPPLLLYVGLYLVMGIAAAFITSALGFAWGWYMGQQLP